MSQYYNQQEDSYKSFTNVIKYIYYAFLVVIIILFLAKKQYSNLKILFFILFLYFITYSIQPLYQLISEKTYSLHKIIQLFCCYSFLFILFSLFLSFKNFCFNDMEDLSEGKRDFKILTAIGIFSVLIIIWKFIENKKFGRSF